MYPSLCSPCLSGKHMKDGRYCEFSPHGDCEADGEAGRASLARAPGLWMSQALALHGPPSSQPLLQTLGSECLMPLATGATVPGFPSHEVLSPSQFPLVVSSM